MKKSVSLTRKASLHGYRIGWRNVHLVIKLDHSWSLISHLVAYCPIHERAKKIHVNVLEHTFLKAIYIVSEHVYLTAIIWIHRFFVAINSHVRESSTVLGRERASNGLPTLQHKKILCKRTQGVWNQKDRINPQS
jgi:hypothetical protein